MTSDPTSIVDIPGSRPPDPQFSPGDVIDGRFALEHQLGALTPTYASIEMFEGEDPDPRDDIYAFGVVLYQLFAGRHPFGKKSAPKAMELGLTVTPIRQLTRKQNRAIRGALEFHRDKRTATVRRVLDDLLAPPTFLQRLFG